MNEKRKIQHYISQFHLREFTSNAPKRSQVFCFDKKSGRVFLASTNRIGAESYFYDVGGNQDVEAKFFNVSPGFWMNLQLRWDLYHAQQAEQEQLKTIQPYERMEIEFA